MNRVDLILAWKELLRVSEKEVIQFIRTAPYQYRYYQIKKRSGGLRNIHHPTPGLKIIQRWLISKIFTSLRIHSAVHSYRSGMNIRDHASKHLHSNFMLRLDFKDFFPSIDIYWIATYLESELNAGRLPLGRDALRDILRIVCRFDEHEGTKALSIGAPSSPLLSNAILHDFDEEIFKLTEGAGCVYTRYADDVYISTRDPDVLKDIELEVRTIVDQTTPKLVLNEAKTINVSKKARRVVTGITLTPNRALSVGRELKRSIKTRVFLSTLGRLDASESDRLGGHLAFVKDVEPEFFAGLAKKFGLQTLDQLLRRDL